MRMLRKIVIWLVGAVALVAIAGGIFFRVAPIDAEAWHIDPAEAQRTGKPNDFLVTPSGEGADMASPVYSAPPEALMEKFNSLALAQSGASLLESSEMYATYVQRTPLMGFPDYISVKAEEVEGGSALYVYSRSQYGYSDWGVNKARVLAWLNEL